VWVAMDASDDALLGYVVWALAVRYPEMLYDDPSAESHNCTCIGYGTRPGWPYGGA